MSGAESEIVVTRLPSGWYHVRSQTGVCEWAQPPHWPCDEETLRAHAFPEASEDFIRNALAHMVGVFRRRKMLCGCKIERVSRDSLVVGLCAVHEAYPHWLDLSDEYADLIDFPEPEAGQ